jgi:hypothetical protein
MSVQLRPTFEIYLDDSRYAVPTLHLVPADDVQAARLIAQKMLDESVHHRGAELCFDGQLLAALGTFAIQPRNRASEPFSATL